MEPTADCPAVREGFEDVPGFEMDIELRPGLLWSDGEALDMDDVKYTVDWILDPDNTGLWGGTDGYDLMNRIAPRHHAKEVCDHTPLGPPTPRAAGGPRSASGRPTSCAAPCGTSPPR